MASADENLCRWASVRLLKNQQSMQMLWSLHSTRNIVGTLLMSYCIGLHKVPNHQTIIPRTLSIVIRLLLSSWL